MKTKILKEFDELNETLIGKEYTTVAILKNKILLSKALDQTREETIREVREKMRSVEVEYTGDPFTDNMIDNTIIDYYNKLKSIIN